MRPRGTRSNHVSLDDSPAIEIEVFDVVNAQAIVEATRAANGWLVHG